jgi:hypothetical protein
MNKIVLFSFAAITFAMAGCQQKQGAEEGISTEMVNNPITASSDSTSVKDLPVIKFEELEFKFGTIKQGDKIKHAFKFKNAGKSDLIISAASGSCGCTIPEYSNAPIKPNEEGVVFVTFDSKGKHGEQNKTVTVMANTIPNRSVVVLTGMVETEETKK